MVPHLSARLISDDSHLKDIACRLHEVGVKDVFAIAGDAPEPAGKFAGSVDLLAALSAMGTEFEQVGIGGYPERHPLISDETTVQAMNDKLPYATYIVSQICFQPRLIESWVHRVRDRGVQLPIYVGIPGSVSMTKLMRISGSIGLGDSARFLKKYGKPLPAATAARRLYPRRPGRGPHPTTRRHLEQPPWLPRLHVQRAGEHRILAPEHARTPQKS